MVRIAIVALALTRTVADEDVYHHTQLLQTKVSPQKVAVDAGGVKDDVALFQSSLYKKTFQSSKKAAQAKFMAFLQRTKAATGGKPSEPTYASDGKGDWSSDSGNSSDGGVSEEEIDCKTYYGDACDVEKFMNCAMEEFDTNTDSWFPDPNVGMKNIGEQMDNCMGATNTLTEKCQGAYGEDVGLFDCMMCGMICECPSPEECDAECHMECMANDEKNWDEDGDFDGENGDEENEECKLFYGDDVDVEKCEDCGKKCWEEAAKGMDGESAEKEKEFLETFGSCSDKCMGQTNLVTQACQKHYGPDVDVFECTTCGMYCNCDLEGCEESSDYYACHPTCMNDDWAFAADSSDGTSSFDGDFGTSSSSWKLMKTKVKANMQNRVKAMKASKKVAGDATDLMQTSQHLKK